MKITPKKKNILYLNNRGLSIIIVLLLMAFVAMVALGVMKGGDAVSDVKNKIMVNVDDIQLKDEFKFLVQTPKNCTASLKATRFKPLDLTTTPKAVQLARGDETSKPIVKDNSPSFFVIKRRAESGIQSTKQTATRPENLSAYGDIKNYNENIHKYSDYELLDIEKIELGLASGGIPAPSLPAGSLEQIKLNVTIKGKRRIASSASVDSAGVIQRAEVDFSITESDVNVVITRDASGEIEILYCGDLYQEFTCTAGGWSTTGTCTGPENVVECSALAPSAVDGQGAFCCLGGFPKRSCGAIVNANTTHQCTATGWSDTLASCNTSVGAAFCDGTSAVDPAVGAESCCENSPLKSCSSVTLYTNFTCNSGNWDKGSSCTSVSGPGCFSSENNLANGTTRCCVNRPTSKCSPGSTTTKNKDKGGGCLVPNPNACTSSNFAGADFCTGRGKAGQYTLGTLGCPMGSGQCYTLGNECSQYKYILCDETATMPNC